MVKNYSSEKDLSLDELNYIESRVRDEAINVFLVYGLWFFLGYFGVHRFILKQKRAFLMLSLCIISLLLTVILIGMFGFIILFCWWIYDATQIQSWINQQKDKIREDIKFDLQSRRLFN